MAEWRHGRVVLYCVLYVANECEASVSECACDAVVGTRKVSALIDACLKARNTYEKRQGVSESPRGTFLLVFRRQNDRWNFRGGMGHGAWHMLYNQSFILW